MLFLGFLNILDLLNLVINHTYFYDFFKIYYTDFQSFIFRISSLFTPSLLVFFFFSKLKFKFKYLNLFHISSILIAGVFLSLFVLDSTYQKVAFLFYYFICFTLFLYLINKNKTFLKENNILFFFLTIFYSMIFFLSITLFYLIYNDIIFGKIFGLVPALDFDISNTFIKFLYNIRLIVIPIAFLTNPFLLFGSYYFVSRSKLESSHHEKNHWSYTRFEKINKVDYKIYEELNESLTELILKIIQLENQYIRNEILYNNFEDISQIINEKTQSIEFIFKYYNSLSFSKYLIKIKMLRAAFLIEDGYLKNNTVTQLSQLSGYNSRSAFFTKFKQVNGYSPKKY